MRAFYEKWYTPERMAVVVVGDFEDAGADCLALLRCCVYACIRYATI